MRRRNLRKQKKIIIISSLCLLLCLCVGYAAFNTQLSLKAKGNIKINLVTTEDLKALAVTEGDGLYQDEYEEGRFIYKGDSPNNYITFNNETWRILSVEADGRIKIVRNELLSDRSFDTTGGSMGSNSWDRPADLKTYLNGEYLDSITVNKEKIVPSTWSIGTVTYNNDLAGQIASENGTKSQIASVGLITASEYLRTNTNKEQCENMNLNNANSNICEVLTWLFKGITYWTISPNTNVPDLVFTVGYDGVVGRNFANAIFDARPSVYLSSDITLSGSGLAEDPFIIM